MNPVWSVCYYEERESREIAERKILQMLWFPFGMQKSRKRSQQILQKPERLTLYSDDKSVFWLIFSRVSTTEQNLGHIIATSYVKLLQNEWLLCHGYIRKVF